MKLLKHSEFVPQINQGDREGIHVSDVLSYTGGVLGKIPDDGDIDDESKLRITLGLAFEDWLGAHLESENENFIYHPDEYERNGIIGSPDGILVDPKTGKLMPVEMKCSAKSARHDPIAEQDDKWWYWIRQGMSYVCILPDAVPVCKYIVCHINGAYEKYVLGRARIVEYDIQFTQRELEKHWDFMQINAGRVNERKEQEELIK